MPRVLDNQPDVLLLGKFDACSHVGCGSHVDSIVDVVALQAWRRPWREWIAAGVLLIGRSKA